MGFAPAGIKVPELRMDRDGRWFVDGERIEHERTQQVLTRNLRLLDDGTLVTNIGRETAPAKVEDVAFFVAACELGSALQVELSDGTSETSANPVLRMEPDGRLYMQVKDGRAWARFLRAPHQQLAEVWEEEGGAIGLRLQGRLVTVAMS